MPPAYNATAPNALISTACDEATPCPRSLRSVLTSAMTPISFQSAGSKTAPRPRPPGGAPPGNPARPGPPAAVGGPVGAPGAAGAIAPAAGAPAAGASPRPEPRPLSGAFGSTGSGAYRTMLPMLPPSSGERVVSRPEASSVTMDRPASPTPYGTKMPVSPPSGCLRARTRTPALHSALHFRSAPN